MKTDKNTKILVILSIMLLIAFAGCTAKKEQTINTSSGDVKTSVVTGTGPDWCKAGTSITSSQQGQGQYSFVVKGITSYKGQEVCEADAAFDHGGQSGSLTYYFSQDSKYMHVVMKDATGNILNDMDVNNQQGGK